MSMEQQIERLERIVKAPVWFDVQENATGMWITVAGYTSKTLAYRVAGSKAKWHTSHGTGKRFRVAGLDRHGVIVTREEV
jgi:hypothetical protein